MSVFFTTLQDTTKTRQQKTYVLRDVHVEDVHRVEVDGVKAARRSVQHLQPLTFLDRHINHDRPICQAIQRLYNTRTANGSTAVLPGQPC